MQKSDVDKLADTLPTKDDSDGPPNIDKLADTLPTKDDSDGHGPPNIAGSFKSSEELLSLKAREQDLKERQKYAQRIFHFLCVYCSTIIVFIVVLTLVIMCRCPDKLDGIVPYVPVALIATMPPSMVLFGWFIRGLFNVKIVTIKDKSTDG